jgi:hypothetical protein
MAPTDGTGSEGRYSSVSRYFISIFFAMAT